LFIRALFFAATRRLDPDAVLLLFHADLALDEALDVVAPSPADRQALLQLLPFVATTFQPEEQRSRAAGDFRVGRLSGLLEGGFRLVVQLEKQDGKQGRAHEPFRSFSGTWATLQCGCARVMSGQFRLPTRSARNPGGPEPWGCASESAGAGCPSFSFLPGARRA